MKRNNAAFLSSSFSNSSTSFLHLFYPSNLPWNFLFLNRVWWKFSTSWRLGDHMPCSEECSPVLHLCHICLNSLHLNIILTSFHSKWQFFFFVSVNIYIFLFKGHLFLLCYWLGSLIFILMNTRIIRDH